DQPVDEEFFECYEEHDFDDDYWPEARALEDLAKEAKRNRDYGYEKAKEIIRGLARFGSGDRHRSAVPREGHVVALGAYSYGAFHGINNRTMKFPQCVLYLNSWAKEKGFKGPWTSVSVAVNVGHALHRDPNNLVGSANQTTSFGDFAGGRLWLEAEVTEQQATDGEFHEVLHKDQKIAGHYVTTKGMIKVGDYVQSIYAAELQVRSGRKLIVETSSPPEAHWHRLITNLFKKYIVKAIPHGYKYEIHVFDPIRDGEAQEVWVAEHEGRDPMPPEVTGASAITFSGTVAAPIKAALT
ncbi:GIP, partial [Symbiodinium sp. KB8]